MTSICCSLFFVAASIPVPYIYTETPRYVDSGGERFPAGATLQIVSHGRKRPLVPDFSASADAAISFDGRTVLFSAKRRAADPWQIWEVPVPVAGGAPRRVTSFTEDAITPFYLPGERVVYARRTPQGFQIETATLAGATPLRLTYTPGDHLVCDVLRDGRVLFEAPHPASAGRDLYTVYTDGSGVETHRCDHGRDRHAGRELASGDIIFEVGDRLARFTSPRATQVDLPAVAVDFIGPIAEISPDDWLVSSRSGKLDRWRPTHGAPEVVWEQKGRYAVQPVLVCAHDVPKRHPSGLGDRQGANLLCLNTYVSRSEKIPAGSVAAVRVSALVDSAPVVLGQAPVEKDGSFFVQIPSETAIRFELLDAVGKCIAGEKGWFWARRGEQRVCVGCHAGPERAPENASPAVLLRTQEPVKMALPVLGRKEGTK